MKSHDRLLENLLAQIDEGKRTIAALTSGQLMAVASEQEEIQALRKQLEKLESQHAALTYDNTNGWYNSRRYSAALSAIVQAKTADEMREIAAGALK